MSTYADLEIRILDKDEKGYPVEMTLDGQREFPRGYLDASIDDWVPTASPEEDGQALFERLFADDALKGAWAEVRGINAQRRVRLRIDDSIPELHAIPWELLTDGVEGGAQATASVKATPFSRYLAGRWMPGSPIIKRPIRILVAVASPDNLDDYSLSAIDSDVEWSNLQEAMADVDGVKLERMEGPCSLTAIESALRGGYHILHLVGHGMYSKNRDQTVLYLADEENKVALVNGEALAAMLTNQLADMDVQQDNKLRMVFLSSCQTATASPADAFRAVAPALVAAGVPAVLAMQDLVPVDTARAFSRTFYQQLLLHGQVDLAANEARATVTTAKLPGAAIPVLFMRLKNGQLLGSRGRIAGTKMETFWPFLLENIRIGHCIPFIGPGVTEGLLPSSAMVAQQLGEKYGYPLGDSHDLTKVAQFIGLNDPHLLRTEYTRMMRREIFKYLGIKPTKEDRQKYKDANFTQTAEGLGWAEKVLGLHEGEIHHMLADLNLPLYITTNFDSFMYQTLKHKGRDPRRVGPRWEQVKVGTPQFTLTPEPSTESPVIFHINGYDEDEEQHKNLVLSEDDYFTQFVRMSRDHDYVLPMNVVRALGESSFLFLGYDINSFDFRLILQGILKGINRPAKLNVGVQLEENPELDTEKVTDYFQRYLDRFNIQIYWGTTQQFMNELYAEWQEFNGSQVEDSGAEAQVYEEEDFDDDDW